MRAVSVLFALMLAVGVFTAGPHSAAAQALVVCPAAGSMTLAQQGAGSSTVVTTINPAVLVKAAADVDPQSFHVHYYVDTPVGSLKPGDVIPAGNPQIVHSGALTLDLKLTPGSHTVIVVLGQLSHAACGDSSGKLISATTTFTVAAQASPTATVAAPKTGNAGLSGASSTASMALVTTLAVAAVGGAALARRRI